MRGGESGPPNPFASAAQPITLSLLAAALVWPALIGRGILVGLDTIAAWLPWAAALRGQPVRYASMSDSVLQFLPWREFAGRALRGGEWPLWNPYVFAGHPTFGVTNEQAFYPPALVGAALDPAASFGWLAWAHLTVAGVGVWWFVRLVLRDDASAVLAGLGFMLSGPVVVWVSSPPILYTISWAGLILALVEATLRLRGRRFAVGAGIALGLCWLAGMTQISLWLTLLVGVYAASRLAALARVDRSAAVWTFVALTAAGFLAAGIAAVAYLPALELLPLTHRVALTPTELRASALPVRHAVVLLDPDAFVSPVDGHYSGALNFSEATLYLGLLVLVLGALLPLLGAPPVVWTFLAATVVLVTLVFGWPPAVSLAERVPLVGYFGLSRLALLLPLPAAVLAASSFARLPASGPARLGRSVAILLASMGCALGVRLVADGRVVEGVSPGNPSWPLLLVGLGAVALILRVCRAPRSRLRWLAPVVLAIDLLGFGAGYNTVAAGGTLLERPAPPLDQVDRGPYAPRSVGLQSGERGVFAPNLGVLWRIPTPDGYASQSLNDYRAFLARANREQPVTWLEDERNLLVFTQVRQPYLDLLGVRSVLSPPNPLVLDTDRVRWNSQIGPIAGSRTAGAIFRPRQDGLSRIDLYPAVEGNPSPPWVALHLKAGPGVPEHLSYIRIDRPRLERGQPLSFYFEPIRDSSRRSIYLYFDAPEARPDEGIGLLIQSGSPADGSLLENDQPVPGALAMRAYAAALTTWTEVAAANETALYRSATALPRAFIVHRVSRMTDEQFFASMDDGTLDPARMAAVPVDPPPSSGELGRAGDGPPPPSSPVELLGAQNTRLRLEAALERPGLLVVTNSWHPGWTATVDGVEAEVHRVDAAFQGVYLDAGRHEIELAFRPASLTAGLSLAAAGVLASALIMLRLGEPPRPGSGAAC
ncbi:MAG TPA: YfhO family protein [Chloroflexota bacterium]